MLQLAISFKRDLLMKLSHCNKLSDYNFASKLEENTEVHEQITFEEIVINSYVSGQVNGIDLL